MDARLHTRLACALSATLLALTACGGGGAAATVAPSALSASTPPAASTGDAVPGRAIYQTICVNCHNPNPNEDRRGVRQASASSILFAVQAINQMRFLRDTIGAQEAADLAVWLAQPD